MRESRHYLAPAFRGTGASNALQRYVDSFLRQRGLRVIELNVEPSNQRAVRYYTRVGYHVVREILREGRPVLRMRKTLDAQDA
jgi:ribosomal protein S18 acetylase RimI-like enzyme